MANTIIPPKPTTIQNRNKPVGPPPKLKMNPARYLSNVSKSMGYATIDKIANVNPYFKDLAETNADLGKAMFSIVKDLRGSIKRGSDYVLKSKFGEFGMEFTKASIEDLKTGKFYNKERIDEMNFRSTGFDKDSSWDSTWDDDIDSILDDSSNSHTMSEDTKDILEGQDYIASKVVEGISASTSSTVRHATIANAKALFEIQKQNEAIANRTMIGITSLHSTVSQLNNFNAQVVQKHVENSQKFYSAQTDMMKQVVELLSNINETASIISGANQKEEKKSNTITLRDITLGGAPDISQYAKRIGQNLSGITSGAGNLLNMFSDGNILLAMAGSPWKFLMDKAVSSMFPKSLEKSFKKLNETGENFFDTFINKMNGYANQNDNGLLQYVGRLFGIDTGAKSSFNTSKYKRGPIAYDGESKLAITQVIPSYLARIESILTGEDERLYDYNLGRFVNSRTYVKDRSKAIHAEAKRAGEDVIKSLKQELNTIFDSSDYRNREYNITNSYKKRKQLLDQFENLLEMSYRNGTLIDFNNNKKDYTDFGFDNEMDWNIVKLALQSMSKSSESRRALMSLSRNFNSSASRRNDELKREYESNSSINNIVYGGYNAGQFSMRNNNGTKYQAYDIEHNPKITNNLAMNGSPLGILFYKDSYNHSLMDYIREINSDINYIKATQEYYNTGNNSLNVSSSNFSYGQQSSNALNVASKQLNLRTIKKIEETKYNSAYAYNEDINRKELKAGIEKYKRELKEQGLMDKSGNIIFGTRTLTLDDLYTMDDDDYVKEIRAHLEYVVDDLEMQDNIKERQNNTESIFNKINKRIQGSGNVDPHVKEFFNNATKRANSVPEMVERVIDRIDVRLYESMYGSPDKKGNDGLLTIIKNQATYAFSDISSYIIEEILKPTKQGFIDFFANSELKDKAKEKFNYIYDKFKGSTAYDILKEAGESSKNVIKKSVKDTVNTLNIGDLFNGTLTEQGEKRQAILDQLMARVREFNTPGLSNESRDKYTAEAFNTELNEKRRQQREEETFNASYNQYTKGYDNIDDAISNFINRGNSFYDDDGYIDWSNIPRHAKGARQIKKTGLAVLSKGEMVIPSELNPFYHGKTDKSKQIQEEKDIAKKYSYLAKHGTIPTYNRGSVSAEPAEPKEDPDLFTSAELSNYNIKQKIKNGHKYYYYKDANSDEVIELIANHGATIDTPIDQRFHMARKFGDKDNLAYRTSKRASDIAGKFAKNTNDYISKKFNDHRNRLGRDEVDNKLLNEAIDDTKENIRTYAPEILSGGFIGGGLSLLTGAIGGPLLGAAVGAAVNFTSNSTKVQDWLFGKKITGDDGIEKRTGNVLSADMANNIEKYFPDMAKGGIAGAITGILPFVPGGPVAGVILGSAIGFAKNNEKIKQALFGSEEVDGLLPKDLTKKIHDATPDIAIGSIAGMIAGPFGLVPNLLIGGTLGYVSTTEKFKTFMFGEENEDGKREGGVVGAINDNFVTPVLEHGKTLWQDLKTWFKEDVKDPIKNAIAPLSKSLKLAGESIGQEFHNLSTILFGGESSDIGVTPLRKITDMIIKPAYGATKFMMNATLHPAQTLLSLPAKAIGSIGEHARWKQIQSGNANYMTAQERLEYAQNRYNKRSNRIFGNLRNSIDRGVDFLFGKNWSQTNYRHSDFDKNLYDLRTNDPDTLYNMSLMMDRLDKSANVDSLEDKALQQSTKKMNKILNYKYHTTERDIKNISKAIHESFQESKKTGHSVSPEKVLKAISKAHIPPEELESFTRDVMTEYQSYMTNAVAISDRKAAKSRLNEYFNAMGMHDVDLNNPYTYKKYKLLIDKETQSINQDNENPILTQANNHHNELVQWLEEINTSIQEIGLTEEERKSHRESIQFNIKRATQAATIKSRDFSLRRQDKIKQSSSIHGSDIDNAGLIGNRKFYGSNNIPLSNQSVKEYCGFDRQNAIFYVTEWGKIDGEKTPQEGITNDGEFVKYIINSNNKIAKAVFEDGIYTFLPVKSLIDGSSDELGYARNADGTRYVNDEGRNEIRGGIFSRVKRRIHKLNKSPEFITNKIKQATDFTTSIHVNRWMQKQESRKYGGEGYIKSRVFYTQEGIEVSGATLKSIAGFNRQKAVFYVTETDSDNNPVSGVTSDGESLTYELAPGLDEGLILVKFNDGVYTIVPTTTLVTNKNNAPKTIEEENEHRMNVNGQIVNTFGNSRLISTMNKGIKNAVGLAGFATRIPSLLRNNLSSSNILSTHNYEYLAAKAYARDHGDTFNKNLKRFDAEDAIDGGDNAGDYKWFINENGVPMRYELKNSSDGTLEPVLDEQYAENADEMKKIAEEKTLRHKMFSTVSGFSADIKGFFSKIFFFKDDDSVLKKLFKVASVTGAFFTASGYLPDLINWGKEHILPGISKIMAPFKDAMVTLALKADHFVQTLPDRITEFGEKIKKFLEEDFPRVFSDHILPRFFKGVQFWSTLIFENIGPIVAETVKSIVPSLFKGVGSLFTTKIGGSNTKYSAVAPATQAVQDAVDAVSSARAGEGMMSALFGSDYVQNKKQELYGNGKSTSRANYASSVYGVDLAETLDPDYQEAMSNYYDENGNIVSNYSGEGSGIINKHSIRVRRQAIRKNNTRSRIARFSGTGSGISNKFKEITQEFENAKNAYIGNNPDMYEEYTEPSGELYGLDYNGHTYYYNPNSNDLFDDAQGTMLNTKYCWMLDENDQMMLIDRNTLNNAKEQELQQGYSDYGLTYTNYDGESLLDMSKRSAVRSLLTGGRGSLNHVLARVGKGSIKTKSLPKVVKLGINLSKKAFGFATWIPSMAGKMSRGLQEGLVKNGGKTAMQYAVEQKAVVEKALTKVLEDATVDGVMKSTFKTKKAQVVAKLKNTFYDSVIKASEKSAQKAGTSLMVIGENAAETASKATRAGKILGRASVVLNVAFIVSDFYFGYQYAANYLNILKDDCPVWVKVLTGVLKAALGVLTAGFLNGDNILAFLIPIVYSVIAPIVNPLFSPSFDLSKAQQDAIDYVKTFNENNYTKDITLEDINNDNVITLSNAIPKFTAWITGKEYNGPLQKKIIQGKLNKFNDDFQKVRNEQIEKERVAKETLGDTYVKMPSIGDSNSKSSGIGGHNPITVDETGFISQLSRDNIYKPFNYKNDTRFQTIGDSGCGPAVAAMALNSVGNTNVTLDDAAEFALRSNTKDYGGGVNASYFEKQYRQYGFGASYNTSRATIENSIRHGIPTVLLGNDPSNKSKDNSPFGFNDHYVLATGLSGSNGIIIKDPEQNRSRVYDKNTILHNTQLGIGIKNFAGSGSGLLRRNKLRFVGGTSGIQSLYSSNDTYYAQNDLQITATDPNGDSITSSSGNIQNTAQACIEAIALCEVGGLNYNIAGKDSVAKGTNEHTWSLGIFQWNSSAGKLFGEIVAAEPELAKQNFGFSRWTGTQGQLTTSKLSTNRNFSSESECKQALQALLSTKSSADIQNKWAVNKVKEYINSVLNVVPTQNPYILVQMVQLHNQYPLSKSQVSSGKGYGKMCYDAWKASNDNYNTFYKYLHNSIAASSYWSKYIDRINKTNSYLSSVNLGSKITTSGITANSILSKSNFTEMNNENGNSSSETTGGVRDTWIGQLFSEFGNLYKSFFGWGNSDEEETETTMSTGSTISMSPSDFIDSSSISNNTSLDAQIQLLKTGTPKEKMNAFEYIVNNAPEYAGTSALMYNFALSVVHAYNDTELLTALRNGATDPDTRISAYRQIFEKYGSNYGSTTNVKKNLSKYTKSVKGDTTVNSGNGVTKYGAQSAYDYSNEASDKYNRTEQEVATGTNSGTNNPYDKTKKAFSKYADTKLLDEYYTILNKINTASTENEIISAYNELLKYIDKLKSMKSKKTYTSHGGKTVQLSLFSTQSYAKAKNVINALKREAPSRYGSINSRNNNTKTSKAFLSTSSTRNFVNTKINNAMNDLFESSGMKLDDNFVKGYDEYTKQYIDKKTLNESKGNAVRDYRVYNDLFALYLMYRNFKGTFKNDGVSELSTKYINELEKHRKLNYNLADLDSSYLKSGKTVTSNYLNVRKNMEEILPDSYKKWCSEMSSAFGAGGTTLAKLIYLFYKATKVFYGAGIILNPSYNKTHVATMIKSLEKYYSSGNKFIGKVYSKYNKDVLDLFSNVKGAKVYTTSNKKELNSIYTKMTQNKKSKAYNSDDLYEWYNYNDKKGANTYLGKGSGFISQLDPRISKINLGINTMGEAGCGPAVASMAINNIINQSAGNSSLPTPLQDAIDTARNYNTIGGTSADYFSDIFSKYGASASYTNSASDIKSQLKRGQQVVLLGQDASNRSKENSPFGPNDHYVLATGIDKHGNVKVEDPEMNAPTTYDSSILNNTKLGVAVGGDSGIIKKATKMSGGASNKIDVRATPQRLKEAFAEMSRSFWGGESPSSDTSTPLTNDNMQNNSVEEYSNSTISETKYTGSTSRNQQSLSAAVQSAKSIANSGLSRVNLVNAASKFIGLVRYNYGSNNMEGGVSDCSAFTQYIFKLFGISIGRDTLTQVRQGTKKQTPQIGDLVFFNYKSGRYVSHVGISLGGNQYIHCGVTYGVSVGSLDAPTAKQGFVCAVDILSRYSGSGSGIKSPISAIKAFRSRNNNNSNYTSPISAAKYYSAKGSSSNTNNTSNNNQPNNKQAIAQTPVQKPTTTTSTDSAKIISLLETIANNSVSVKEIVQLLTKIVDHLLKPTGKGSATKEKYVSPSDVAASKVINNKSGGSSGMADNSADIAHLLTMMAQLGY